MDDIIEALTDMERDRVIREAWESNPKRPPYDEVFTSGVTVGRQLMDVARDAFAAVRAAHAVATLNNAEELIRDARNPDYIIGPSDAFQWGPFSDPEGVTSHVEQTARELHGRASNNLETEHQ